MNRQQAWKNFDLEEELHVCGAFIYSGLRRFYEMNTLNNPDEVFEVLYNISRGLGSNARHQRRAPAQRP
jgi:hypothetical protein